MFNLFKRKPKHEHVWKLVATNNKYTTNYTDTGETKTWHQRFYKCDCGARKHTDDKGNSNHSGIEEAKENWIDAGVVPGGSIYPDENTGYYKPTDNERKELDPILQYQLTLNDIAESLKIVLNRDIKLEEKYPELKEAADEYHRRLDKYRTFEILKE